MTAAEARAIIRQKKIVLRRGGAAVGEHEIEAGRKKSTAVRELQLLRSQIEAILNDENLETPVVLDGRAQMVDAQSEPAEA